MLRETSSRPQKTKEVLVKILGLMLVAFLAAGVIPYQAIVNGRLGQLLQNPLLAALVSFVVGTITLLTLLLVVTPGLPSWPANVSVPWHLLTGGLCGVIFVTVVLILVPKIGTANLLAATVAGQLVMAMLIDHFAWLGVPRYPISPARVLGCLMLMGGLLLIQWRSGAVPAAPSGEPANFARITVSEKKT